ncbi:hypothetical protein J4425_00600 [Candidatus Woesearchaeota archaeon]|nr:hypothetical protein [Candidatus Woesearchaeota archaeon]
MVYLNSSRIYDHKRLTGVRFEFWRAEDDSSKISLEAMVSQSEVNLKHPRGRIHAGIEISFTQKSRESSRNYIIIVGYDENKEPYVKEGKKFIPIFLKIFKNEVFEFQGPEGKYYDLFSNAVDCLREKQND